MKKISAIILSTIMITFPGCDGNGEARRKDGPNDNKIAPFNMAATIEKMNNEVTKDSFGIGISRLDSVKQENAAQVNFYYTLTQTDGPLIDKEEFKVKQQKEDCENYKTSPTWYIEMFRINNISIGYYWNDSKGQPVCSYICSSK